MILMCDIPIVRVTN